jgi:hypothetical protein
VNLANGRNAIGLAKRRNKAIAPYKRARKARSTMNLHEFLWILGQA